MSGTISSASAELAHQALCRQWSRAEARRNGAVLTPALTAKVRAALTELEDLIRAGGSAVGTDVAVGASPAPRFEVIDVAEAARRLQVSDRAVRKRLAKGTLPGRKVGPVWAVEWEVEADGGDGDVDDRVRAGGAVREPGSAREVVAPGRGLVRRPAGAGG